MNELVQKLSEGDHPVEASVRPEKTLQGFKAALDRGYVHIRFTQTRGGTELGFKVDPELSDTTKGDFEAGSGHIRVGGTLTLDYERVRCIAEIDLSSLDGRGHLELLGPAAAV
jgi:hypothetical protein